MTSTPGVYLYQENCFSQWRFDNCWYSVSLRELFGLYGLYILVPKDLRRKPGFRINWTAARA